MYQLKQTYIISSSQWYNVAGITGYVRTFKHVVLHFLYFVGHNYIYYHDNSIFGVVCAEIKINCFIHLQNFASASKIYLLKWNHKKKMINCLSLSDGNWCWRFLSIGFILQVSSDKISISQAMWQCCVVTNPGPSLVRGTPTAGVLLHWVIISRRWERIQQRDSEWPINTDSPRKKSAAMQWTNREITGPKNTQNWHHFTRTSSSTHSKYLRLLTLLHLVLLSSFSM